MIPLTGRKHQIRLHSKEIGCSILGDAKHKYHDDKKRVCKHTHLHLHAYSLNFRMFSKRYKLKAELPSHFLNTMKKYFLNQTTKGYEF